MLEEKVAEGVAENTRLTNAAEGVIAVLTQNKTYPADIVVAVYWLRRAIDPSTLYTVKEGLTQ